MPDPDNARAVGHAELPLIDIAGFGRGDSRHDRLTGEAVVRACEGAGFLYLGGHGIPEARFLEAREQTLEFFHSPGERKKRLHISRFSHHRGYVGHGDVYPDVEKGGDVREAFKVAEELPADDPDHLAGITLYGPNVWPDWLPGFRPVIYDLYLSFQGLSASIFSLFAAGLGLPLNYFAPMTRKPASVMNLNYYPAAAADGEASGIGAHSDYEAFAMLWTDGVSGLQIESPGGEWQAVRPLEGALVINIGDLMQRWTNNRFRATRHRVINVSGRERVSFACFGNTNYHALIECLAPCISADRPPAFEPITAGAHLQASIANTYAYVQGN